MYSIILTLLGLTVIGSFICASVVVNFDVTEGQKNMLAFMLTCFVSSVGYFLELISVSEDGVLNAMRFRYMGLAFMMIFFCEYVYYYVDAKKSRFFFKFLGMFDFIIVNMMWYTNHFPLFFQKLTFKTLGNRGYYEVDYGPVYYLYLVCCFLIPSACGIWALYKKAKEHTVRNYKMINILMFILVSVPLCYVVTRWVPSIHAYDFTIPFITLLFSVVVIMSWREESYLLNKLSVKFVIDEITDQIIVVNGEGYIVDCNEAATSVLGLEKGMLIHEGYDVFKNVNNNENQMIHIGEQTYELRIKEIWEKGRGVLGYIYLLTDVTALQNQMEELKIVKEKAEEANKAKTLFLSNMSHEIRTPMNSIMGITEVLLRENLAEQDREYLLNIRNSGNSLISIINDILDFSKVESGIFEIVEKEYDPMTMLNDLGLMFMSRIGDKPIELLFYVDSAIPKKLIGDEIRVRQVIINMVNNAIKYTKEGKIEFTWKIEEKTGGEVLCFFQIKDTGCGIAEKDMPKLFHPFQRVDSNGGANVEGTGLGLSICKAYIEKMGGSLWADSRVGLGSIFSFRIPQKIADERPAIWIDERKKSQLSLAMAFSSPVLKRYYFKLAEKLQITITDVAAEPYREKMFDYFFTDSTYYNEHMVSDIAKNTVVVQNVLRDKAPGMDVMIAKKPFYEYPFCMVLNGIKEKIDTSNEEKHYFTASEAKVLLVDDNEMNRKVACDLLKPLNMKFDTAENGEEAVFLYENRHYDLILMDHMMPVMDGEEATKKIRELEREGEHIPIIALTANAIVGVKEQLLSAGMDDFVTKPVTLKNLYEVLYQWLPKNKIVLTEEGKEQNNFTEEFKEKDFLTENGFDVKTGLFYCGSVSTYLELLKDFYTMLPYKIEQIRKFFIEKDLKNYVVEVHSMKTSLKTIGLPDKAEYFLALEMAGKEEDLVFIEDQTQNYLGILEEIKKVIGILFPEEDSSEQKEVSKEQIQSVLSMMLEALEVFDFDAIDSFMEELNTYRVPDETIDEFKKLKVFVADVSYGNIKDSVQKILKQMNLDGAD